MKLDFRGLNNTNKVSEGILYYVRVWKTLAFGVGAQMCLTSLGPKP